MQEESKIVYKAYDFSLDENNNLVMNLYNVSEEKRMCKGKVRTFRLYDLTDRMLATDKAKKYVGYYRDNGYLSINELCSYNELVIENVDIATKFRLAYLANAHQIVEKIYCPYEIDKNNLNVIAKYVKLINVFNGEQSVLFVGAIPYSDDNVKDLEVQGYHFIMNSTLDNQELEMTRKRKIIN